MRPTCTTGSRRAMCTANIPFRTEWHDCGVGDPATVFVSGAYLMGGDDTGNHLFHGDGMMNSWKVPSGIVI